MEQKKHFFASLCVVHPFCVGYLHDNTHSVKIDKITSEAQSNLYGVPKRSILGPIPFTFLSMTFLKLVLTRNYN